MVVIHGATASVSVEAGGASKEVNHMVSQLVLPSNISVRSRQSLAGRPAVPSKVLLSTGLSIWRGTVSEEYLADLKPWSKAYKVFKEMEDDTIIGTLYESIKAPLLDAKFEIIPASPSNADVEAAEWLEANLINSKAFSWLDHVDEMLDFMSFGFAISEKVLEKRMDGRLWLADLVPIGQDTLLRWGDPDKNGRVTEFVQSAVTSGSLPQERHAPMDKLLHLTFQSRKRDPMGRSLSRKLYRPWYFKKNLEVVEAIGAERDVGNVPVAELGEGFYNTEDIDSIRDALEGLRIDETAYLMVPHGTKVAPFGAGGKVYNIREMIRDYQHIIRQRFFMDFVSLGSEQVGTQALAKEVTGFFSLALGSVQRQMVEPWNQQVVPWLFRWNRSSFSGITELPRLKWVRPGKLNIQSLAQSVSTLLASNAIHYNKPLEDAIRADHELPPITDEELAAAKEDTMSDLSPGEPKGEVAGGDEKEKLS
jgi:hypothetical protein